MRKIEVSPGEKHNMLTFIRYAGYKKNDTEIWVCKCECGNTVEVKKTFVTSGHTKSCGCLKHKPHTLKHGKCNTRLYNIHQKMKSRCYKKYEKCYKYYGGKGIKICDEWLGKNGFQNFYDWAIKNGYQDELTIDRIDVNRDYEPNNCRWVNYEIQENNRCDNRYITFNGKTLTIAQWSRELGISENALTYRLEKWDLETAMTKPLFKPKTYDCNGETHTLSEWSELSGIKYHTLLRRINKGLSIKDALTKKNIKEESK